MDVNRCVQAYAPLLLGLATGIASSASGYAPGSATRRGQGIELFFNGAGLILGYGDGAPSQGLFWARVIAGTTVVLLAMSLVRSYRSTR